MLEDIRPLTETPQDVVDNKLFQELADIHQALNSILSAFQSIKSAADDTEAASIGVNVGEWYIKSGVLAIRIS